MAHSQYIGTKTKAYTVFPTTIAGLELAIRSAKNQLGVLMRNTDHGRADKSVGTEAKLLSAWLRRSETELARRRHEQQLARHQRLNEHEGVALVAQHRGLPPEMSREISRYLPPVDPPQFGPMPKRKPPAGSGRCLKRKR